MMMYCIVQYIQSNIQILKSKYMCVRFNIHIINEVDEYCYTVTNKTHQAKYNIQQRQKQSKNETHKGKE